MHIEWIQGGFSVAKLEDYSRLDLSKPYTFVGRTDEENSLVCLTDNLPSDCLQCEHGWTAFRIQGQLDFSLVGILAEIAVILANAGISIFAVSTFNTDYILVKEDKKAQAIELLKEAGHTVL